MCSNKTLAVAVDPKPQPRPPSSLFPTKKHSEARVTFATSEDASVVARALAVDPEVRSGKRERKEKESGSFFLFFFHLFRLFFSLFSPRYSLQIIKKQLRPKEVTKSISAEGNDVIL